MKILDRYILTTYLKTFFSVFMILMLIFVLQSIWLYIKELAGKELDLIVVLKFLTYVMPKLIPLVLPLTILLTSIMVFGSFAENYEFAAMKSTGISLQRAMSGLSVFIVILGIVTFFFSNNVIPWSELKFHNLRLNMGKIKPSMAIVEGQFNPIESTSYNINIKVEKKSGDIGQYLEGVTIHEINNKNGKKNTTVIRSKTGELSSSMDSDVLKLILFNGHIYKENPGDKRNSKTLKLKPFVKSSFEKKIINIDLSQMNQVDFNNESLTDKYTMLNINGLNKTIDSLVIKYNNEHIKFAKNLNKRSGFNNKKTSISNKKRDTLSNYLGPILDIFDKKRKEELVNMTSKAMVTSRQLIIGKDARMKRDKDNLNKHIISLHEKFALGFACVILFFVGAPLGALIKKGGIGLPMVIAILLFLTYHFIGIFATNSGKTGGFNPIIAPWFSTMLMLPLSIYLTKRATADRSIFEFGNILDPFKNIFKIKNTSDDDYKYLLDYKNNALINTINSNEINDNTKLKSLDILNSRGISMSDLRLTGLNISKSFDVSKTIKKHFKEHSKFALALYISGIILLLLFFIFKNNKLVPLSLASIQLSIISLSLYIIYFVKSIINTFQFYNHINKKQNKPKIQLLILGVPLYFIIYIFLNYKINNDLKINCLESLK